MKSDLHIPENRLPGLLPEAEARRLKTRQAPVEMATGPALYETGNHAVPIRLRSHLGRTLRTLLLLVLSCYLSPALPAHKPASSHRAAKASQRTTHHAGLDRSGKTLKGKASYYSRGLYSKKMADGTRMNPQSNAAASKTLPLGTKARVTNLENGKSQVVEIRDRGPYVGNRIVDVSPKTATKLGLKENGTALVKVTPLEIPQPDGSVKPGAGAAKTRRGKSPPDSRDSHASR
jgi:rare lipoprotein A